MKHLIAEGRIEVCDFSESLVDSSLKQRLLLGPDKKLLKQPQGYLRIAELIDSFKEDPPEDASSSFLVLDSLSRAAEHMRRLMYFIQGSQKLQFDEWKFVRDNLEELFDAFFSLQPHPFKHVVMIAHEMTERDDILGIVKTLPLVEGQMRGKCGGFVEEQYYCFVEVDKQGDPSFIVQTKPSGRIVQARSSRDIPTYITADFKEIFKEEYEGYCKSKETSISTGKRKRK
jgi:hypothetical protein